MYFRVCIDKSLGLFRPFLPALNQEALSTNIPALSALQPIWLSEPTVFEQKK